MDFIITKRVLRNLGWEIYGLRTRIADDVRNIVELLERA